MMALAFLKLANNNLSGRIPKSFERICWKYNYVKLLHFQNNSFIGELPMSLMNCSSLKVIDFGENKLFRRIPTWIGTSLKDLVVLRLPSKIFVGSIPLEFCQLTFLQILDLCKNGISETVRRCLKNFTVMYLTYSQNPYIEHAFVNTKGLHLEYDKTLGLIKVIDLSSNKLKGEIPREITSLIGLIGLNLAI
jgi:EIX receptor 1/2